MDINIHLEMIRHTLEELSSSDYQDRVWVKGLGPEVSSYEEACCRLLDDLMFEELLNSPQGQTRFNRDQIRTCKKLIEELSYFNQRLPRSPKPIDIVNDKTWIHIRAIAAEALKAVAHK